MKEFKLDISRNLDAFRCSVCIYKKQNLKISKIKMLPHIDERQRCNIPNLINMYL